MSWRTGGWGGGRGEREGGRSYSVLTLRKRLATQATVIIEEIGTLQMPQETKGSILLRAKDLKKNCSNYLP